MNRIGLHIMGEVALCNWHFAVDKVHLRGFLLSPHAHWSSTNRNRVVFNMPVAQHVKYIQHIHNT